MSGRVINYGYLKARILSGTLPAWLLKHKRRKYIEMAANSTPTWADRKQLLKLAKLADEKERLTGVPHVLDHIIPLNHPFVCGLTVHYNMRVIPKGMNTQKSNDLNAELFEHPEQLRIF